MVLLRYLYFYSLPFLVGGEVGHKNKNLHFILGICSQKHVNSVLSEHLNYFLQPRFEKS